MIRIIKKQPASRDFCLFHTALAPPGEFYTHLDMLGLQAFLIGITMMTNNATGSLGFINAWTFGPVQLVMLTFHYYNL